jgi:hypothetical protein
MNRRYAVWTMRTRRRKSKPTMKLTIMKTRQTLPSTASQLCCSAPSGFSISLIWNHRDVPKRIEVTSCLKKAASELTGISLPVKILARIAVAFQVQPHLLTGRAMCEGNVVICNLVEKVNLFLLEHDAGRNGMDWGVSPSLIEEATVVVKSFKVVNILLRSQPLQASNLKVGPLSKISVSNSDSNSDSNSRTRNDRNSQSDICCMSSLHHHSRNPWHFLLQYAPGDCQ